MNPCSTRRAEMTSSSNTNSGRNTYRSSFSLVPSGCTTRDSTYQPGEYNSRHTTDTTTPSYKTICETGNLATSASISCPPEDSAPNMTVTSSSSGRDVGVRRSSLQKASEMFESVRTFQPSSLINTVANASKDVVKMSDDLMKEVEAIREKLNNRPGFVNVRACLTVSSGHGTIGSPVDAGPGKAFFGDAALPTSAESAARKKAGEALRRPLEFSKPDSQTSDKEDAKDNGAAPTASACKMPNPSSCPRRDVTYGCRPCQRSGPSTKSDNIYVSSSDALKVGTSVRILAPKDKCQPAHEKGAPHYIIAVVTYVTQEGMYKLGTTKGLIGRLFTRDELVVKDHKSSLLKVSNVPRKSITMLEAGTTSYACRD